MAVNTSRSNELFDRALGLLPGGVSSPVRAFRAVGGSPIFIAEAEGAYFTDVDGNRFELEDYTALDPKHQRIVELLL